jgi:hypothetical protein
MAKNRLRQIVSAISSVVRQRSLPHYQRIRLGYEPTYYGACHLIAQQAGIQSFQPAKCYVWSHGCRLLDAEDVRYYIRHPNLHGNVLVARTNEKTYLEQAGIENVHAVGMPVCYTLPKNVRRKKNSLLVMPPHATHHSKTVYNIDTYIDYIQSLRHRFSEVVFCVSRQCLKDAKLKRLLFRLNIPVIYGGAIDDKNSLQRIADIFKTYDYVSTNCFGSHIAYAMAFGARVSIAGPLVELKREHLINEPFYKENPDLIESNFLASQNQRLTARFSQLLVDPWTAERYVDCGRQLIGQPNVRSAREMAELLGLKGA